VSIRKAVASARLHVEDGLIANPPRATPGLSMTTPHSSAAGGRAQNAFEMAPPPDAEQLPV